jgi:Cysteine dioxygenase type I
VETSGETSQLEVGSVLADRFDQFAAPRGIDAAHAAQMAIEPARLDQPSQGELVEGRRAAVVPVLLPGDPCPQVPDGSFSVVALISRPGQATSVHDHTTWCAVAVIAGTEYEKRFGLNESGRTLLLTGTRTDQAGTVSGFAPPGDIHRVTNAGTTVGVSLHVYGTDIGRIGSSVRRTYDLPIVEQSEID